MSKPFERFRVISLAEGVSFLLLLGVAMPLKYLADLPLAVLVVGWIHGVLFIAYMAALAHVWRADRWRFSWVVLGFIAAVLPFGPFVFDRWVRREAALSRVAGPAGDPASLQ